MQIIIVLDSRVALALHQRQEKISDAYKLLNAAQEYNGSLKPIHPGACDELLLKYFVLRLPDSLNAERVRIHFQEMAGVEASYIKPQDELP